MLGFLCALHDSYYKDGDTSKNEAEPIRFDTKDPFSSKDPAKGNRRPNYEQFVVFPDKGETEALAPDADRSKWRFYREFNNELNEREVDIKAECIRLCENWINKHVLYNKSDLIVGRIGNSDDIDIIINCKNIILEQHATLSICGHSSITRMSHGARIRYAFKSQIMSMEGASTIITADDCVIGSMEGNSEIQTSTGKTMINIMTDNCLLQKATDETVINRMEAESKISSLNDQAIVDCMSNGNPNIFMMLDNSTVKRMMDGNIDHIGSGRVNDFYGGTIGEIDMGGKVISNFGEGYIRGASVIEDMGFPEHPQKESFQVYKYNGFIKAGELLPDGKYHKMLRKSLHNRGGRWYGRI